MKEDSSRIIQSEHFTIKLLSGATIQIRPLTLEEREHCFSFIPSGDIEQVTEVGKVYLQVQGDLLHYIITRLNPTFKREDIDKCFDTKLIEKIFKAIFNDPFEEMGA